MSEQCIISPRSMTGFLRTPHLKAAGYCPTRWPDRKPPWEPPITATLLVSTSPGQHLQPSTNNTSLAALRCFGACSSHLGACRAGQVRAFAPSLYKACASATSNVLSPSSATMHTSNHTYCNSLSHMHHGHHTLMRDSPNAMLLQQEAFTSPCYPL